MILDMKPFENIARKGENAGNQHFLLFPQCFQPCQKQKSSFSTLSKTKIIIFSIFIMSSANAFNLHQSRILSLIEGICRQQLNPFPNKPWFLRVCSKSLFPTVFSMLLENFLPFSSNLKLLSAISFILEESKICRLGKG